MIEAPLEQPKRKGNPNFGKKKEEQPEVNQEQVEPEYNALLNEPEETILGSASIQVNMGQPLPIQPPKTGMAPKEMVTFMGHVIDPQKRYRFQLIKTYEKLKPRDHETGELVDSLYPPIFMANNEGIAYDSNGNMRRWRYVYGYPTIWVDEQINPAPNDQQLRDEKNDILFKEGNLFVNGGARAKIMALLVQDQFEDQKNPVTQTPKVFRLINEEEGIKLAINASDRAFEAETEARKATLAEMLPIAMLFGINIDNAEQRQEIIRGELILKARQLPDAFLKQFVNPKNQIKYLVTRAIQKNIISGTTGNLVMVETGRVLFQVDSKKDISEQVTSLIMGNDAEATVLYSHLQRIIA